MPTIIFGRIHYRTTLLSPEEAFHGACTAKTTIYCANIAAGLTPAQFTKHRRGLPVDPDIQLNLLSSELSALDPNQDLPAFGI